jgi:class 3 adenylate cyclase
MATPAQRLKTILFADIAGSTRLYDRLGDQSALALISHCLDLMIVCTQACNGTLVKTIGDEVMCIFDLPDKAVSAAVGMHESIHADLQLMPYRMQVRIGLHHGPVISESGDVYGDAVNIAARMVAQAKGGQIITTGLTLGMLSSDCQSIARLVDQTRVMGKPIPIDVYELAWGQPDELTMITHLSEGMSGSKSGMKKTLALYSQGEPWKVSQSQPVISMGRDTANEIVVNDPRVSRMHARIELRKDRFIIVDQSTNGTYLMAADGRGPIVRRDEIVLPPSGLIGLGEKAEIGSLISIRFEHL